MYPRNSAMPKLDEPRSVGFHLVRDGPDEGAFAGAHLLKHFGNAVLTGDGKVLLAARLASGIENAQGAGISGGGHQDALALAVRRGETPSSAHAARLAHAAALDPHEPIRRQVREAARECRRMRR